jgi:hypothetical protein
VFGIATSRLLEIALNNYLLKSTEAKREIFKGLKLVKKFNDIDLSISILDR